MINNSIINLFNKMKSKSKEKFFSTSKIIVLFNYIINIDY